MKNCLNMLQNTHETGASRPAAMGHWVPRARVHPPGSPW